MYPVLCNDITFFLKVQLHNFMKCRKSNFWLYALFEKKLFCLPKKRKNKPDPWLAPNPTPLPLAAHILSRPTTTTTIFSTSDKLARRHLL
jgi:hypothetical protein